MEAIHALLQRVRVVGDRNLVADLQRYLLLVGKAVTDGHEAEALDLLVALIAALAGTA